MCQQKNALYHFTTLEAFYQIWGSGKLRLTSCNDAKNKAVETMWIESMIRENCINYSEDEIKKLTQNRENAYVTCFTSIEPDDEQDERKQLGSLEYMWKYYAGNNTGVIIKFDSIQFPKFPSDSDVVYKNDIRENWYRIIKIEYDHEEFITYLKTHKQPEKKIFSEPFYFDGYKPQSCSIEKEIRLLLYWSDQNNPINISYEIDDSNSSDPRYFIPDKIKINGRPKYFYYEIRSQFKDLTAIQKVFCRNKETQKNLSQILKPGMIELIPS